MNTKNHVIESTMERIVSFLSTIANAWKDLLRAMCNIHVQGKKKNIFLFSTPRGGSTWVMELFASQKGMKYFDEPMNIRRRNVQRTGLFEGWKSLMPGEDDIERITIYLNDLAANRRYRFMNPPPFRRFHRVITNRCVFKIHECEHRINDIKKYCKGSIVYLLRHPIPNSLSRHQFPRLDFFCGSQYIKDNLLSEKQYGEVKKIVTNGSHLEKGIVSWCFQNFMPLKDMDTNDWIFLTYEELLLNTEAVCKCLMDALDLSDYDALMRAVNRPAVNISMSDSQTLKIMKNPNERLRKMNLVRKWKNIVNDEEERNAMDILKLFGLDTYRASSFLAHDRYLLNKNSIKAYDQELQAFK